MRRSGAAFGWLLGAIAATVAAEAAVRALVARSHSIIYTASHVDLTVLLRMPIPIANKIDNGWTVLAVVWVWLAVLAYCGHRYARSLDPSRFWPLIAGFVAICAVAAAFPVFLSADPYAYILYGRLYGVHGVNPYYLPLPLRPQIDAAIAQCLTIYGNPPPGDNSGPLWTLGAAAESLLTARWPLAAQAIAQRVVAIVFAAIALCAAQRMIRGKQASDGGLGRYAFHPLLIFETAVGAHNDTIMIAFGLWAFALVEELPLVAGVLLGVSIAVKYVSIAALPFLVVKAARRDRRAAVAVAALALFVAVISWSPFFIGRLTWSSLAGQSAHISMSPTWLLSAALAHAMPASGAVAQGIIALLFCIAYAWALARFARQGNASALWTAVAAMLWAAPMLNPWYALWLLPAVIEASVAGRFAWWFCALALLRYSGEVPIYPPVWVLAVITVAIFGGPLGVVWMGRRKQAAPAV